MTTTPTEEISPETGHSETGNNRHWVDLIHSSTTAWIILGISLIITLIAWTISDNYSERRARERFQYQIEEAQNSIQKRFVNYEQVLLGGLGLFKASTHVDRNEWHEYISTLEINKFFPGTLGVGYSLWLSPEQLPDHIQHIRQQGFPDFTVRPTGQREHYSSIIYLEPFNERNQRAFGYDMHSEPVRREAMTRARDSGKTAVSGKVTLVQETSSGVQYGFLIYVPHYTQEANTIDERRQRLTGFVYSALRIGDLMQGILGVGLPEIDFSIYDGTITDADNMLYDTSVKNNRTKSNYKPRFWKQMQIEIGGRTWTIKYRTNPDFDTATSTSQPALVATGGIIIDFLLFNIILSLTRLRQRAQVLADERMKKLHEQELKFKAISDNANDAIITIDEQKRISYINNSALLLFEHTEDAIIGEPATRLFPPQKIEIDKAINEKFMDKKTSSINNLLEINGIKSSGTIFPLELSLATWKSGGKKNITAIIRDITERKKIDTLKDEFVSTISHELRTPLTSINGALMLIENGVAGDISDKAMELIKNAHRNSDRLATMVNELLDIDKISSGKMKYDFQQCDIAELINKSIELNRGMAQQNGISLDITHQLSLTAYVDPNRFTQVMTNLLSNAIKFSPPDSAITTNMELIDNEVKISITDHGCGIPSEFHSRIFSKFAQADSSDTRKFPGTGLGLSIVKLIIEEFKGRIEYTSIPDKETTFFFFLPISNAK